MVWLTGGAAGLSVLMILGLLGLVAVFGFGTFWPTPVARIVHQTPGTENRTVVIGEPFRTDTIRASEDLNGNEQLDPGEDLNGDGELQLRLDREATLWRTGNKDIGGVGFRWVADGDVVERDEPEWMLAIERYEWSKAYGQLKAAAIDGEYVEGPVQAWAAYEQALPRVRELRDELQSVKEQIGDLGELQREAADLRRDAARLNESDPTAAGLRERAAKIDAEVAEEEARLNDEITEIEAEQRKYRLFVETKTGEILPADRDDRVFRISANRVLEREAAGRVAAVRVDGDTSLLAQATPDDAPMGLTEGFGGMIEQGARVVTGSNPDDPPRLAFLDEAGEVVGEYALPARTLVTVADGAAVAGGRPVAVEPLAMQISQIVRAYPANRLSFFDKLGVYGSRWWEFLSEEPREANTEGGVLPQIVGTVLLTFIMVIFVVPIGVVAAIYLREYARQGLLVSLVRISVNNLAGVPSIVYGVFGLGFFAYAVGGFIDEGAAGAGTDPLPIGNWLLAILAGVIVVLIAVAAGTLAGRSEAGAATNDTLVPKLFRFAAGLAWAIAAGVVFYLVIAKVPTVIFDGFNTEASRAGQPKWEGGNLIWASLTLALLTLPVVIVATEEALAAVPRSMREGSYACGASKWQTIRRIVLPRALPGIMTGAILAISRGAGEVAPIMLVGALKVAEAPLGGNFPYIQFDQAFAHLGFHIFDLGFQSPDAEAARSSVYTTTLLLIAIVLVLNLSAIWIRSRLRRAYSGGQF
jgi:ABC-type phosphate transport system permease subunit